MAKEGVKRSNLMIDTELKLDTGTYVWGGPQT
jgi:hypothetical protein